MPGQQLVVRPLVVIHSIVSIAATTIAFNSVVELSAERPRHVEAVERDAREAGAGATGLLFFTSIVRLMPLLTRCSRHEPSVVLLPVKVVLVVVLMVVVMVVALRSQFSLLVVDNLCLLRVAI